jgi:hypothetical protein
MEKAGINAQRGDKWLICEHVSEQVQRRFQSFQMELKTMRSLSITASPLRTGSLDCPAQTKLRVEPERVS